MNRLEEGAAQETSKPADLVVATALERITKAWYNNARHIWLEGGTWASKTWSVMQFLALLCQSDAGPYHISVISETMPHLKRGAMLDFIHILGDGFRDKCWNKSDFIYRWPKGSVLEFFSADVPSKAKGGRRDILFANEVNHIERDIFRQADMRTRLLTIADWNPESEFWFHEENLSEEPMSEYIHLTYLDALEVLPDVQRREIEKYEELDPNWWNVYGLGMTGKIEGLVYPHFEQVDELPDAPRFYGLDYGFSSDPTVLTANVLVGDKLYSQEMFYDDTGLTNGQISMKMQLLKVNREAPIYADPDEPKSAVELRQLGWNMGDTVKGRGSVVFGIQKVNQLYQHWTKDSLSCIKEQRNCRFIKKRDPHSGQEYLSDDITHRWSHGMDSRRYAVASHIEDRGGLDVMVVNRAGGVVERERHSIGLRQAICEVIKG